MLRRAIALLLLSSLGLAVARSAAQPLRADPTPAAEAGSAYSVGGIKVDVAAGSAEAARLAAFRIAQRQAWPMLWSRLTGNPAAQAPRLPDNQLDSIVAGIESQGERFSTTRYIATLGVVFDRSRVAGFLSDAGGGLQSPPMLLLPVLQDGGVRTIHQQKTIWTAAWTRFRENVTPIDYVLAPGTTADNLLLSGWQTLRPARPAWRTILTRFDTVDVLVAEARLNRAWPGGPISGVFTARHGPDGEVLGRFSMQADNDDGLEAMLEAAVRQIDAMYAGALRSGRLQPEAGLAVDLEPVIAPAPFIGAAVIAGQVVDDTLINGTEVAVITPDAAALAGLETALRQVPGVTAVTITSLSLGGSSRLLISHAGSFEALTAAMAARGLAVVMVDGVPLVRRAPPAPTPAAATDAVPTS